MFSLIGHNGKLQGHNAHCYTKHPHIMLWMSSTKSLSINIVNLYHTYIISSIKFILIIQYQFVKCVCSLISNLHK